MDTKNFKDRSVLRSYFVKNKIPTEANFADLINSSLNQVEDGIFKPTGDPVSLVAAGDNTGPQKLLNFYGNAADAKPTWTLQMRPRADQNDPATAHAGFSVSDGDGRSRIYVDAATGNVGIGTVTPDRSLTIGNTAGANYMNVKDGTREILMGVDSSGGIVSTMSNHDLAFRTGGNREKMRITAAGAIGIGTATPTHPFHLVTTDAVGLLESTGAHAYLRMVTAEGMNNRIELANRPGGRLALWVTGAGDAFSITRDGKVGINTTAPGAMLTVNGSIGGGETATGWVLGHGAWNADNWLRLTTPQNGAAYHDLAINSLWSAGLKRFDLAEVTPVNEDDKLEQGDVVVIDPEQGLRVTRCRKAGDTAVYGVVSSYEQAAMVIGGVGGPEAARHDPAHLPVAMVGRVAVKVSAENGPIRVGDMLTTAETPGHAMRCTDRTRHAGAIVGKALEPLAAGTGVIKMLVAMQ